MIATICAWLVAASLLPCIIRIYRGPKLADRVVAIDLAGILTLALIIIYVHLSEELVYLDVAIVLALIAFLGTVVFARFLEKAPRTKSESKKASGSTP